MKKDFIAYILKANIKKILCNLQMGQVSWSVCLCHDFPNQSNVFE
jgi:hypothetical protein